MDVSNMIYKVIDEKCLKQSAVARAAGYDPKIFNTEKKKKSRDHEKYRKGVGRNEEGEDLGRAAAACVSDAEGIRRADEH